MSKNKMGFIFALVFPIACLLALTFYKAVKLHSGVKITLPISGYDPRDLFSGHYLIYQVNYNCKNNLCGNTASREPSLICIHQLDNGTIESEFLKSKNEPPSKACTVKIEGQCEYGRFKADIERFYIPEEYASQLDQSIRGQQGKIIVSVDAGGKAMVQELLIQDQPWLEFIQKNKKNF